MDNSIVGGIFYKPQQKQELTDIYGDVIDLQNMFSSYHSPISSNLQLQPEYEKPYSGFIKTVSEAKDVLDSEDPIVVQEQPISTIILKPQQPKAKTEQVKTVSKSGKHTFKTDDIDVGNMQDFLDEAAKYGIYFRITSGYRPDAKTASGKRSWHALGEALDVTPIEGETYADLSQKIKNNPEFVKWMQNNGYGIYDETSKDVQKKTEATGAHWHIGKDVLAVQGLKKIIS